MAQLYRCHLTPSPVLKPYGGGTDIVPTTTGGGTATQMRYGISAGTGNTSSITAENTAVHPNSYLIYDTTSNPTYSSLFGGRTSIPDTATVFIAINCNTTTQLDALMSSFPSTRTGKVYWAYRQEPENNKLPDGSLEYPDPAVYRDEGSRVYAAIDRARAGGKAYMVKSSCFLPGFGYEKTDSTHPAPIGRQSDWVIPGQEHIGWSMYASSQNKSGHMVAAKDAVVFPQRAAACAKALGLAWGAVACGFAIPNELLADTTSINNRVAWFDTFRATAASLGCTDLLWFNVYWTTSTFAGDYRVETDTLLYAAWQKALLDAGQYAGPW